jgi:GH24 family phage-related lysozyme (muramidase)
MTTLNPTANRSELAGSGKDYTVRSGDTLSEIAQKLGLLLRDLIAANPQIRDPNLIRSGQQLNLPGAVAPAAAANAGASAPQQSAQGLGLSQRGLDLIKGFEGLRLKAYQDSAGVWTIGYGHTSGVRPGQQISQAQAEQYLRSDVKWAEQAVRDNVKVPISQQQFDALTSFTFNLGAGALKDSTLLKKLNQGNYAGAQAEFGKWVHAGGQRLEGLVRRRAEEARLFGGSAPAPGAAAPTPAAPSSPSTPAQPGSANGSYVVRQGDTLWDIARAHGVSLQSLIAANPQIRNPDLIFVNQRINLPGASSAAPAAQATSPAGPVQPAAPGSDSGATDAQGRRYATSADGTPIFRQGDAAWGGRILGDDSSIASAGCAMTAVAMALSKISGRTITPAQLDGYLDKNGGYAGDGLVWGQAADIIGAGASKPGWSLSTINRQLDAGRPVVMGVDYKAGSNGGGNGTDHWITVTGRGTVNGQAVYYANDPATGQQITLRQEGNRLVGGPKNYRSTGELVVFSGGR